MSDNAKVLGIYEADPTPDSAAEKAYDLVNDNNSEGFNTWTISAVYSGTKPKGLWQMKMGLAL